MCCNSLTWVECCGLRLSQAATAARLPHEAEPAYPPTAGPRDPPRSPPRRGGSLFEAACSAASGSLPVWKSSGGTTPRTPRCGLRPQSLVFHRAFGLLPGERPLWGDDPPYPPMRPAAARDATPHERPPAPRDGPLPTSEAGGGANRVFNPGFGDFTSDQRNVNGATDQDHELITHRAWSWPAFVVELEHGPDERPRMTGRYPRATSRGRRVRPGNLLDWPTIDEVHALLARLSCKRANGASSGAPFARPGPFAFPGEVRLPGTAGMSALSRMTGR